MGLWLADNGKIRNKCKACGLASWRTTEKSVMKGAVIKTALFLCIKKEGIKLIRKK